MIYNDLGKPLTLMVYFDEYGERKVLNAIYKALGDGNLRLVWGNNVYLIVTPDNIVWAHPEFETEINIQSNTNWINF